MLSHYGHIPLGVGVGATALGLLLLQRRLTVAAVAVAALPVLVALGGNAVVNRVAFHEPGVGVATKRLPVLLARSLADGPARWHLEENCDTEGYAICEVFAGNYSSNLGVILWSDEGLGGASPAQMDRIRAEEATILRRAFMEHPAEQIWSFAGNAVSQTWTFGMDDFSWARLKWLPDGNVDTAMPDPDRSRAGLDATGLAHLAGLIAATGLILVYAARDRLGAGGASARCCSSRSRASRSTRRSSAASRCRSTAIRAGWSGSSRFWPRFSGWNRRNARNTRDGNGNHLV